MKNIKKISLVLFIAILHNLFLASCTDKNTENNANNKNNTITSFTSDITDNILAVQPAVSAFTYEGDFVTAFQNPERGYHTGVNITGSTDFQNVNNMGLTVVISNIPMFTYYNLTSANPWNDNITENLPEALLNDLQKGLDAVREAGLKVILRPEYGIDWAAPVCEHWDIVVSHLKQIDEIISKNADVVMGIEAGVLGPWGEWHSYGIYTDSNSIKGAAYRYQLVKLLLDTTPDSIPVMIRDPRFIKEIFYISENPQLINLGGQDSLTTAQLDRIGFHNDGFVSTQDDYGTYAAYSVWWGVQSGLMTSNSTQNQEQRKWVDDMRTSIGSNIMMRGESPWEPTLTEPYEKSVPPLTVLTEMANVHTTTISADWNPQHIQLWKDTIVPASGIGEPEESVYDRLDRRMGYRLRLTEAEFTTAAAAGGEFKIKADIINDGYAGIVNARPAFIVFNDGANRYDVPLDNVDVRLWMPGKNTLDTSFSLPSDMVKGMYTVALWLPDAAETLRRRSDYSVRFADKNIWDVRNGYNKLGELVIIS
ncbi:MAG: DUF4832 domain-containing protein [Oscillospiraceae bacterium]|nr:DUF4832 domain-containing protein [Oscillospiraceae bacterium]